MPTWVRKLRTAPMHTIAIRGSDMCRRREMNSALRMLADVLVGFAIRGEAATGAIRREEEALVGVAVDVDAAEAPTQCREKMKVTVRGSAVSS